MDTWGDFVLLNRYGEIPQSPTNTGVWVSKIWNRLMVNWKDNCAFEKGQLQSLRGVWLGFASVLFSWLTCKSSSQPSLVLHIPAWFYSSYPFFISLASLPPRSHLAPAVSCPLLLPNTETISCLQHRVFHCEAVLFLHPWNLLCKHSPELWLSVSGCSVRGNKETERFKRSVLSLQSRVYWFHDN